MTDINKEFTLYIAALVGDIKVPCDTCGGHGGSVLLDPTNIKTVEDIINAPIIGHKPCPTCAPERERLKKIKERLCWHEYIKGFWLDEKPGSWCKEGRKCNPLIIDYDDGKAYHGCNDCPDPHGFKICKLCGASDKSNPTYTIESIVALMKEVGAWERFISYMESDYPHNGEYGTTLKEFAEIMKDPIKLMTAIMAQGRE